MDTYLPVSLHITFPLSMFLCPDFPFYSNTSYTGLGPTQKALFNMITTTQTLSWNKVTFWEVRTSTYELEWEGDLTHNIKGQSNENDSEAK